MNNRSNDKNYFPLPSFATPSLFGDLQKSGGFANLSNTFILNSNLKALCGLTSFVMPSVFGNLKSSMEFTKFTYIPPHSSELRVLCGLTSFTDTLPIKELQQSLAMFQPLYSNSVLSQVQLGLGTNSSWVNSLQSKVLTANMKALSQTQNWSVISNLTKNLQPIIPSSLSQSALVSAQQSFKQVACLLAGMSKECNDNEYTDKDFEAATQEPLVQKVVAAINDNVNHPDETLALIVDTLQQIKITQDEQNNRLSAIEKNIKPKPLVIRIIIGLLCLVLQCFCSSVIADYVVKPTKPIIALAKHEIIDQFQTIIGECDELISQYKFVCVDSITLHQSHRLKSRAGIKLNFKSVVRVLGKYRKWNQVAYIIDETHYYIGWIQNYKLKDLK